MTDPLAITKMPKVCPRFIRATPCGGRVRAERGFMRCARCGTSYGPVTNVRKRVREYAKVSAKLRDEWSKMGSLHRARDLNLDPIAMAMLEVAGPMAILQLLKRANARV